MISSRNLIDHKFVYLSSALMYVRIYILTFSLLIGSISGIAQVGFIENKGQFNALSQFEVEVGSKRIYLQNDGFTLLLHNAEQWSEIVERFHGHSESKQKHNADLPLQFHVIKYQFVGADFSRPELKETFTHYLNYFIGNDPSKWASHVSMGNTVFYRDIYPGIDLEYVIDGIRFKYNLIVHPGAELQQVKISIKGADQLDVEPELISIATSVGDLHEYMPVSYVISDNGNKDTIETSYTFMNGLVGFKGYGEVSTKTTVVDPELIFSTYAGNSVDNFGFTATYDSHGNLYSGGIATSPTSTFPGSYPVTPGAFDTTYNGGKAEEPINMACDITINKYDATGSNLLFATYLGGSHNELPHSLIVDSSDNLIVFGTTKSYDFPVSLNAAQPIKMAEYDIIVTKFTETGDALLGSTFIGGDADDGLNKSAYTKYFYADDFRGEVMVDSKNQVYIGTSSWSNTITGSGRGFSVKNNGQQDGVVIMLKEDLSSIIWSSFLGGSGADAIYNIDIGLDGDIYVSGGTQSTNLKNTSSAGSNFIGGRADGFVARLKPDGSQWKSSLYIGTSGYEQILGLEIDKRGAVWVVGHTTGTITTKGDVYLNEDGKQFIMKMTPNLGEIQLVNTFGSGRTVPDITINAFLVDECDKVFVSGWGGDKNGAKPALRDMPLTKDAIQPTTDGWDFYLIVFTKDLEELIYATYFGGNRTADHVDGGTSRFDKKGVIYQSVCASCPNNGSDQMISDFPTTDGAYAEKNISPRCSNASFKIAFGNLNRKPVLNEMIYHARVGEITDLRYPVYDPDKDTLKVWVDISEDSNHFINPTTYFMGVKDVECRFQYKPDCELIGDTITVPVYALDVGCPSEKDSHSLFRIVITPPPVVDPPTTICLNFSAKNSLRISWESMASNPFFKELHLYRVDPNGDTSLLTITKSTLADSYLDQYLMDPRKNNYTYFMIAYNICDMPGPKSYDVSSVKEHEIPVESTYLITATVVDGKNIRIEWVRSEEPDFGHYEIYRGKRGAAELEYYTSVHDVDSVHFLDKAVDVNNISYCYQLRVADNCGHFSAFSNMGCNIVLEGTSPPYASDLKWQEYIYWEAGVDEYEVYRANDIEPLTPIVRVDQDQLTYLDSDLDYDWGGYWYSIIAYENPSDHSAQSRSNDIYLIQPPLVYVPNAFTPRNGDLINDEFGWSDVFVLDFRIRIYNRWGQLVYESTDKNGSWNGIYKNQSEQGSQVYIWIVEYSGWDNSWHYQKGTVTILR